MDKKYKNTQKEHASIYSMLTSCKMSQNYLAWVQILKTS